MKKKKNDAREAREADTRGERSAVHEYRYTHLGLIQLLGNAALSVKKFNIKPIISREAQIILVGNFAILSVWSGGELGSKVESRKKTR